MTHSWDLEENCSIFVIFFNKGSGYCHQRVIFCQHRNRYKHKCVFWLYAFFFFTQVDDQSHFKQSFAAVKTKPTHITVSSSLVEGDKNKEASFFCSLFFLKNLYFPASFPQHKEVSQPCIYSSDLAARLSTTHLHVFFHLTHTYTLKRNFPLILPETHFSSCSSLLIVPPLFLHLHSLHIKELRSLFFCPGCLSCCEKDAVGT